MRESASLWAATSFRPSTNPGSRLPTGKSGGKSPRKPLSWDSRSRACPACIPCWSSARSSRSTTWSTTTPTSWSTTPVGQPEKAVSIFDSQVAGRRLALGTTGYFLSGRPILYDRTTESLWVEDGEAFAAISGQQKGNRLALVARPAPVAWSDWKRQNPRSRLVIGARDRAVKPKAAQGLSSTLKP